MPLQYLMDVGFSYSDFARGGETAVANVGNAAASRLGHECFEADDLILDPFGLLCGMAMVIPVDEMRVFVAAAWTRWNT